KALGAVLGTEPKHEPELPSAEAWNKVNNSSLRKRKHNAAREPEPDRPSDRADVHAFVITRSQLASLHWIRRHLKTLDHSAARDGAIAVVDKLMTQAPRAPDARFVVADIDAESQDLAANFPDQHPAANWDWEAYGEDIGNCIRSANARRKEDEN